MTRVKLFSLVFLFLVINTGNVIFCQDLNNTKWYRFHMERLDGSRIIERSSQYNPYLLYDFHKSTVNVVSFVQNGNFDYSIKDDILKIERLGTFKIKSLTDSMLIIEEIPVSEYSLDKTNRIYLYDESHYYNYLIKNRLVKNENNDTLVFNNLLRPFYKGYTIKELGRHIASKLNYKIENAHLTGEIILMNNGKISEVNIYDESIASPGFMEKFKNALWATSGNWDIPKIENYNFFKIKFNVRFEDSGNKIEFHYLLSNPEFVDVYPNLSIKRKKEAAENYNKGVEYLQIGDMKNSIEYLSKCVALDNIYIDAFYNRAIAYYKLNKIENACSDWKYLNSLGQKEGEKLYKQYCTE